MRFFNAHPHTIFTQKDTCMGFIDNSFYHIYNRGINKQNIFFNEDNYHYFLEKIERHICPTCDIIAYCLMPNHFHLLVSTNIDSEELSEGLRVTLSSYTRAINNQEDRTGSLFQQNTKRKLINVHDEGKYLNTVFNYIHQNPVSAKLCKVPQDWHFSSFNEYLEIKPISHYLCNTQIASKYLEHLSELIYVI